MNTIKIDASALAAPIEADPEFIFELQRTVILEVGRKVFLKDIGEVGAKLIPEDWGKVMAEAQMDGSMARAFSKALEERFEHWNRYSSTAPKLNTEQLNAIRKTVDDLMANERQKAVDLAYEQFSADLDAKIASAMDGRIDYFVQQRIDAWIKARLDQLKASI